MSDDLSVIADHACERCGFLNPEGYKFCAECGTAVAIGTLTTADDRPLDVAKTFALGAAREAGSMTKTILKADITQKIAAGAAIGAAAATLIPFVGLGLGAAVGGGIVAYRRLLK